MHVVGTIQLTLDIQDFLIPVTFHVLHRLQFDVILGTNFLSQTKTNIDMQLSDCDTIFYFVTYYVFLLWSRDDLDIEGVMWCPVDVRDDTSVNKNI